jgi:hypothetical protein
MRTLWSRDNYIQAYRTCKFQIIDIRSELAPIFLPFARKAARRKPPAPANFARKARQRRERHPGGGGLQPKFRVNITSVNDISENSLVIVRLSHHDVMPTFADT